MKVLSSSQIRAAEENAVKNGIFSYAALMENAGGIAAEIISQKYDVSGKRVCVVCGSGNNGGDGLVIASRLKKSGADVSLFCPFGMPSTETAQRFVSLVSDIQKLSCIDKDADFVVDALFGIGLNRPLTENARFIIDGMNDVDAVKIAVDVPSGVFADGGCDEVVFCADLTITFIAYKLCQFLPQTSEYCGDIVVADIGVSATDYSYHTIERPTLAKRWKNSHKGSFGTALHICGSYGMCGAQILAARACLRSGVGILKSVVCDKNYDAFCSSVPEAVTIPVVTNADGAPILYDRTILSSLSNSSALLIGCGLGKSDEAKKLVKRILQFSQIPTIIDADGINIVANDINILRKTKAPMILTPHPAEMARLLDTTVSEIEADRVRIAKKFAADFKVVLVLKGANTIVAAPDGRIYFSTVGNPGMATGGSGDVLSGMISAYLAQGLTPLDAALTAVWLHGFAADCATAKITEQALLPSDIIEELKTLTY